jgi:hypothetical protein
MSRDKDPAGHGNLHLTYCEEGWMYFRTNDLVIGSALQSCRH